MSKIEGISAETVEQEYIETPKGHLFSAREAEYRTEWADIFCAELEPVFRHLGYGLARLGSNVRDVDIIAVPWCKPMPLPNADSFVLELVRRFDLQMGNRGETLNGHRWYALWHKQHRDHQIDLKVMLPSADSLLASGEVILRKDAEELAKEASIQIKNFGCDGSHASHGCDACLFQGILAKFTKGETK